MVPLSYEEWMELGPWHLFTDKGTELTSFHNYWKEVNEGERVASPLVCFQDPKWAMHEVAHLVCVADENVLSPTWGLGPVGNPYNTPGPAHRLHELGVFMVQLMIWVQVDGLQHLEGASNSQVRKFIEQSACSFSDAYTLPSTEVTLMTKWVWNKFPNIEAVWHELQRKYQLIEEQMETL